MPRVLVVGGGILGTFHAIEALQRGWQVDHFDADAEPHDATVRSPGAITPSLAAGGLDLTLSRRARDRWDEFARQQPELNLRACGSLVVAANEAELRVLEVAMAHTSAAERQWQLFDAETARRHNPALQGELAGAIYSSLDAVVEPRTMLEVFRTHLTRTGDYRFVAGREIHDFDATSVTDTTGRVYRGDLVVLCLGVRSSLASSVVSAPVALHRIRVQLLQTEPLTADFATQVADVHTLARHRVLGPELIEAGAPSDPLLGEFDLRFNCVPRASGALTVGEAREVQEPFDFDLAERPAKVLLGRLEQFLGRPAPPVVRRWYGVVQECTDGRLWLREDLDETVALVTGADQRGVTLGPVIAADTFDWLLDGVDSGATRPGTNGRG
jgi:FAD dependent oxidoreductase TIGR03364